LSTDVAWLDAHIVRGTLGPAAVYGGTTQYPSCGAPINPALCSGTSEINYSGYSLGNAPPWSAAAILRQYWHFKSGAELEGLIGTHFDASTWGLYAHIPGSHLPAYTTTDLTLTYRPARGAWSIGAWVKNAENAARVAALATDSIYGQAPRPHPAQAHSVESSDGAKPPADSPVYREKYNLFVLYEIDSLRESI
jgi:iron complex outermembrane receptor protein